MEGTREGKREEQRRMNDVRGLRLVEVFMRGAGSRKWMGFKTGIIFSFSKVERIISTDIC